VRVRFDGNDLVWEDTYANLQGFVTIAQASVQGSARFRYLRPFEGVPTSTEFRIRYNDASGLHEFADKWRIGIDKTSYLVRVNATALKKQPPESEDYVTEQGPQS